MNYDKVLLFVWVIAFCAFGLCRSTAAQKKKDIRANDNWPILRLPNGVDSIPPGMTKDLPFDLTPYLAGDNPQSSEQVYVQLLAELQKHPSNVGEYFVPNAIGSKEFFYDRKFQRRITEVKKDLTKYEDMIRDIDLSRYRSIEVPEKKKKQVKKVIGEFDWVFAGLKKAIETKQCCLYQERQGFEMEWMREFVTRLVQLRYIVEPDSESLIDDTNSVLAFGNHHLLLNSRQGNTEQKCFGKIFSPMLASTQSPEQLDGLIEVLKQHSERQLKIDPTVESAKAQHLEALSGMLNLRGKWVRRNASNPTTNEISQEIHKIGRTYNKDRIERWKAADLPASVVENFVEVARAIEESKRGSNTRHNLFRKEEALLGNAIMDWEQADFDRDIQLLKKRYQEIEAACELSFPESRERLRMLKSAWCSDESWKKSVLLVAALPQDLPARSNRIIYCRMFLCIAAIKKWRMEHNGDDPANLAEALSAIGIDEVPLDAITDAPILMKEGQPNIVVYSVGWNGKDDGAKSKNDFVLGSRTKMTEFYVDDFEEPKDIDKAEDIVFVCPYK